MLNDKKLMLNDETRRSMEYFFYFDKFCFNYTCKICIQKSDILISISRNNRLISFIDKSFFYFSKQVYFGQTNDNKCSKIIIILFL